ncbi:MAG: ABC transporter permease [Methylococcaceae bacterium]|nr:ABC transporter permease [Methylococcaceae bacterium]
MQPGLNSKLHAYLDAHAHALFSSLGRLTRAPAAFMMTVLVLAISMALSSSFYLMVKNFQQLTGNVEATNQISVFLKATVTAAKASALQEQLKLDPLVESVQLITPEQALAEFTANSGYGEAVNTLEQNPLPTVLLVLPKNALEDERGVQTLQSQLESLPEVDLAKSELQWVKRLRAIISLAKRTVFLLSLLFGFAVLLIIGNTIRLELQSRREEVQITQLVGATHAFIRRPFLYTGFWLGFLASIAAWFIVTVFLLFLRQPVQQLSEQYTGQFNLVFLDYAETLSLIGIASALGVLGAWWVLSSQLQALKPV